MKPLPLSVQLYTLREEIKTTGFYEILEKVAQMGYQGVEFAGLHGKDPQEVKKVLDDNGLVASSTHGGFPNKDNINEQIELANLFGYKMHIGGYGQDQFASKEAIDAQIPQAQEAVKLFEGSGISLGYHNHWWEFDRSFDGELAELYFLNRVPGMFAEIDTYWVAVGGADTVDVVTKLGESCPILHIKDGPAVPDKSMVAVGSGVMEWDKIIPAAKHAQWLVVELDRCDTDMVEAVAQSARYLKEKGFAK